MATTVLLLGRTEIVLDDVRAGLQVDADVELRAGTTLDDVRVAFDEGPVDVVCVGAGLDLATRLDIVRHIFTFSESTTVHMKDRKSGPAGMLPFVNAVLGGLVG